MNKKIETAYKLAQVLKLQDAFYAIYNNSFFVVEDSDSVEQILNKIRTEKKRLEEIISK